MPPKAQTSAARHGRPAKVAAPEETIPVAAAVHLSPLKKRGRPSKIAIAEAITVGTPKKRGRPAKAKSDEPIAQINGAIKRGRRSFAAAEEAIAEAPVPNKRSGRPSKVTNTVLAAEADPPKKRVGRPRKEDTMPEVPATPKRGRRPALDLNRVAGSPRVSKRTSPRSKPVARAPKVAAAPRINPKMRSRLRHRLAPSDKVTKETVLPVKKARGRPKKNQSVDTAPKKTIGRKASAPVPAAPAKKVTARPKTAAPRKRRGYTAFEVPDKFATQVKQLIVDLQVEDAANAAASAGEADDEGEGVEMEIQSGVEDTTAGPFDGAPTELVEEDGQDGEERDDMLIDPADVAHAAALDQEHLNQEEMLAREEDSEADLDSDNIDVEDETELPSETAVLAEIAAVQDELDVQDAVADDVQATEVIEPEPQRESSASDVSVNFHEEITEVSSIPQIDGSNEVDVFHTHVDKHTHIHEHAHATEPAASSVIWTQFGGL